MNMYANCMQMPENKKGSNRLKPFTVAVDPAGIEPATL